MTDRIDMWLAVIMTCAGALVTLALTADPDELVRSAQTLMAASADAAGDGEGTPGMGGYIHGFYWRDAITLVVISLLHITGWETEGSMSTIGLKEKFTGE